MKIRINYFINIITIFLLIILYSNCNGTSYKELIGKTIKEAIKIKNIKFGKYFVIHDPPAVGIAIEGKMPNGQIIRLYIDRKNAVFNRKLNWKIEQFNNKKICGVAVYKNNKWTLYGKTLIKK